MSSGGLLSPFGQPGNRAAQVNPLFYWGGVLMKKQQKSEALLASEKAESADLIKRIVAATNTVPAKILGDASYQEALYFKHYAIAARNTAESKAPTVEKLRAAWGTISGYYA
jgi:hypothetical protein